MNMHAKPMHQGCQCRKNLKFIKHLDYEVIYELIAAAIPALSYATGANFVTKIQTIGGGNFNMMTDDFRSHYFGDWKHSDIKNRPPVYTIKVCQKIVEIGDLNK